ncbi:calcium-binding protein 39-like [Tropilaelaps mercedesae]|uniref:Calcium-binding protein 39-like n=1 Tax=Tropilaelaps mercedesae TaxID=418985 RepID=A0A1V9WYT2_9ACAR|nr:calcium-binding protein 39-like [Tropilaelaps mercedesae]
MLLGSCAITTTKTAKEARRARSGHPTVKQVLQFIHMETNKECRVVPASYGAGVRFYSTDLVCNISQTSESVSDAMPLFGKHNKNPVEVVKTLKDALNALDKVDRKAEKEQLPTTLAKALKVQEDVSKNLTVMKNALQGGNQGDSHAEMQVSQLGQEVYSSHLLLLLVQNLSKIDFEGRKDAVHIFNNVVHRQIGTRLPTVEYLYLKPQILFLLLSGYETPDVALNCGTMLRECLRHEDLAKLVLCSDEFYNLFKYVESVSFDVATDAFATLRDLLTRHKRLVAEFLELNYERVITHYQTLLTSENYATRRQSLKLLSEILLDRANYNFMSRYISSSENLKLIMNMLKDKSRNIRIEAFHVFKVFVANPHKPKSILDILIRNREKLADFLSRFQLANENDAGVEQFNEEKSYVIHQIRELKQPTTVNATPAGIVALPGINSVNQGGGGPPLPPPNLPPKEASE